MASGYEKAECGVGDPGLGWEGVEPTPTCNALLMAFAIAAGALQLWGMVQGLRWLFGF